MVDVVVDRASGVPLYEQIARQLRAQIQGGVLVPGERIENEETLAQRLGLSRPTVSRAYGVLVDAGLLRRKRGTGTEVSSSVTHRRTELTSMYEDLARNNRHPRTEVLTLDRHVRDGRAAELLGLTRDASLVHVKRLRFAALTPVAVMENWLPGEFADLSADLLTVDGLYSALGRRGRAPVTAHQRIGAKAAATGDAALLHVRRGTPLVTMESIGYDGAGRPVECGSHVYRADVYSIDVLVHSAAG